ncbi:hypothetical protein NDU88_008388 [Pleurodeles waltl]|uniref:Uncharacterized protein n=1 Tax=Pleurodeles waltl TaxID=8319 RepID=A0AAV7PP09_PLEWA|nr:hypothetical protein NDU88_008388 [Pleurodeles waltl]
MSRGESRNRCGSPPQAGTSRVPQQCRHSSQRRLLAMRGQGSCASFLWSPPAPMQARSALFRGPRPNYQCSTPPLLGYLLSRGPGPLPHLLQRPAPSVHRLWRNGGSTTPTRRHRHTSTGPRCVSAQHSRPRISSPGMVGPMLRADLRLSEAKPHGGGERPHRPKPPAAPPAAPRLTRSQAMAPRGCPGCSTMSTGPLGTPLRPPPPIPG